MDSVIDAETLLRLVGMLYDAAIDSALWPVACAAVSEALHFKNASLAIQALPAGDIILNVTSGVEQPWLARIGDYGAEVVDQWGGIDVVMNMSMTDPAVLSEVNDRANWQHNRFYTEWAVPQGIFDVLAIPLVRNQHMLGSVGLGRHVSAGPITSCEVDSARLIAPHFQRAIAIGTLLDMKTLVAHELEATLDGLATAIILVDLDLRIVHSNRAADDLLASGDIIGAVDGRLVANVDDALALAVQQASRNEAAMGRRGFGILTRGADGSSRVLHVLPLQPSKLRRGLVPRAAAAIFVAASDDPDPAPAELLAALYDLTAAETRVFTLIAAGLTPAEAAVRLAVGVGTVRSQLIRVFAKTGTSRQADLARLGRTLAMPI